MTGILKNPLEPAHNQPPEEKIEKEHEHWERCAKKRAFFKEMGFDRLDQVENAPGNDAEKKNDGGQVTDNRDGERWPCIG